MANRIERIQRSRRRASLLGLTACLLAVPAVAPMATAADALHRVTFVNSQRKERTVDGRIVVEAQDGGIVLEGRDGILWNVTPKQLKRNVKTGLPYKRYSADELTQRLRKEFGEGFEVAATRNYVICSNAGKHYSRWCAMLFERLSAAFLKHWQGTDPGVKPPPAPLVAIIFADRKQYARYATQDAGPSMASSIGYYSARTNRMALFDLTSENGGSTPAKSMAEIRKKVVRVPFNVATVVHEATHQIAFNCGLQTRYADNPLWLSEGLAMFFESPDLRNTQGWGTAGKLNAFRIGPFREFLKKRRGPGSLKSLLTADTRFAAEKTAADAYAEAWALTYFLIKTRRKEFAKYLSLISRKKPLIFGSGEKRLKEFEQVFGDVEKLETVFLRYMTNPRLR